MIKFWDSPPEGWNQVGLELLADGTAVPLVGNNPLVYGEGRTFAVDPWDTVIINSTLQIPGLCKVKCEPKIQIDEKKPNGVDGATLTLGGHLPGRVQIDVTLWTADQWEKFQKLLPILWRKPQKADAQTARIAREKRLTMKEALLFQASVNVFHPALAVLAITAVIVEGISTPEDGSVSQSKVIRLLCRQYLPPGPKTAPRRIKSTKTDTPMDFNLKFNQFSNDPPSKTDTKPTGPPKPTH